MIDKDHVASRLRAARKEAGMSTYEVGPLVGRTAGAVSSWERGVTSPSPEMLIKLCKLYRVDIPFFFSDEASTESSLGVEEIRLVRLFRSLSSEGRQKLFDYMDDLLRSGKYGFTGDQSSNSAAGDLSPIINNNVTGDNNTTDTSITINRYSD